MVILHALGQCLIRTSLATITPRAELGFALATRLIADRGRRFSRRHLAALFWPDADERTAAHSLSEALHKLRRRGLPIETDEAHAVWVPRDAAGIDVERIGDASPAELAERDLSVLPGFEPRGSAALRDWADEWRDELRTRTVRGLRLVIAQAERDEDWSNAMLLAEQVLRLDHTDPVALAARVRAADALRRQGAPHAIASDGATPHDPAPGASPPTQAVREGISPAPRLVCAVSATRPSAPSTPIVGRDAELAVLGEAWDRARHGHGGRVWLHGPSGIGKTRLVTHMVGSARRTLGVAADVACEPGDAQRPLSTFIRLVPRLRRLPGAAGCSPDATPFLDRLTEHDAANPLWPDAADAPHIAACVQQAIVDLVDAIADEQPLLLAVDDAHWIDEDSARLLETLALAAASRPVLLLMSSCAACPSSTTDCVATVPLCLAPLDDDAAREHVVRCCAAAASTPAEELVEWFVDAGEGNPLRLEELVNHWRTTGVQFELPPTLGALLQSRVSALSASARRVLQMAAVLGRHSTFARIERALGFSDEVLLEALEELGHAAMVRAATGAASTDDGVLTCRHGALAEAALAQLSPPALQMLHRRAAQILEGDGSVAAGAEALWDEAGHWSLSGASRRVASALGCVTHLVDIGLVPGAISACRQLVDSCDNSEDKAIALRSLASLVHLTREWDELHAIVERLRSEHPSAITHDDLELLALDAAWQSSCDWDGALAACLGCVRAMEASADHRIRAGTTALKLATNIGCTQTMHEVHGIIKPLLDSTGVSPSDSLVFEMVYNAIVGDVDRAVDSALEILSNVEQSPGTRQLRSKLDCASTLGRTAAVEHAIDICADVAQRAARYGMPGVEAQAYHRAITVLLNHGNMLTAADWVARYDAVRHRDPNPARIRAVRLGRIRIALDRGELEEAHAQLAQEGEELWDDQLPMFRASALTTKLAVDLAHRLPPTEIAAQIPATLTATAPFRCMGAQDYETYVLAAALDYTGDGASARELLHTYRKHDRRDPYPVPERIAAIYTHRTG